MQRRALSGLYEYEPVANRCPEFLLVLDAFVEFGQIFLVLGMLFQGSERCLGSSFRFFVARALVASRETFGLLLDRFAFRFLCVSARFSKVSCCWLSFWPSGCFLPSGRDLQLFGVQLAPGPEGMEK